MPTPHDSMPDRLKTLRKQELGLTLEKFGARLGVKSSVVSCWETNRQAIPDYRVYQICHEFNVNEAWLTTGDGRVFNEPKSADELDAEAFVRVVVRLVDELSPKSKRLAVEAAKKIIERFDDPQ